MPKPPISVPPAWQKYCSFSQASGENVSTVSCSRRWRKSWCWLDICFILILLLLKFFTPLTQSLLVHIRTGTESAAAAASCSAVWTQMATAFRLPLQAPLAAALVTLFATADAVLAELGFTVFAGKHL